MGIDIFLAIVGLVVACAATWFIIRYFLMPSGSTDARQGRRGMRTRSRHGTNGPTWVAGSMASKPNATTWRAWP